MAVAQAAEPRPLAALRLRVPAEPPGLAVVNLKRRTVPHWHFAGGRDHEFAAAGPDPCITVKRTQENHDVCWTLPLRLSGP